MSDDEDPLGEESRPPQSVVEHSSIGIDVVDAKLAVKTLSEIDGAYVVGRVLSVRMVNKLSVGLLGREGRSL